MRVLVDMRETKLYQYLVDMIDDVEIVSESLDIGDVQIVVDDPKIRLIFERKTEKDLAASIKDGRYREQKLRMLHTAPKHHCTYIIENPDHWESHACPPSSYTGAILNTMYRDGMHIVVVPNTQSTAQWIAKVVEKCKEHPDKFVAPSTAEHEYLEMRKVKTKRQDNIDVRTCFQLQICQVPGISQKLASSICEKYESWRVLLKALDACESFEHKVRMLCQIPLIGDKKARMFLEFIQENVTA